jgi:ADP-ribose pyrophosphatase YjhB (NUDIX family)
MQNQKKKQKRRNYPTSSRKATKNNRNSAQKSTPAKRNGFKVPEALPTKKYRENGLSKLKQVVFRKKPEIKEIVREPTAGGIVFRPSADNKDIEILLIQDSKDRWTIPKGHIEPGETAKQTAVREIGEESGLKEVDVLGWLGKIHFKYRRADKLVLMTTQVYLVQSLDKNERPTKEKWMNGIRWFSFNEALDAIEYADIEKLMLIAKKKIRAGDY